MNIRFKRILCVLLVISLMFTLTGCAEGVGILFDFVRRLFVGFSNLGIAGIAYVVEEITYPIFEKTGWCGCGINASLFRGFNRIVNPSGDIIPWQDLTKESLSFHYEHEEYLAMKGKLESEEGGEDRFLAGKLPQTGDGEWKDGDEAPFPEGVEPKSNFWGSLCKHKLTYNEKKNVLKCWCGANVFTWKDVPDWDYDKFSACLPKLQTLFKNQEEYGAEAFLKFHGVNAVFFELLKFLEENGFNGSTLDTLETLTDVMEKVELANKVYWNYKGTADFIDDITEFDDTLDDSLTVVTGLIHVMKMVEAKNDTNEACMEFIEAVKAPISMATSVTGGANTFLLVGLDSLKIVVDAYLEAVEIQKWQLDFHDLALTGNFSDGQFQNQWVFLLRGEQVWNQYITVEHILGTQKVEGLKLPTLPEIVEAYDDLSPEGKLVADDYILYCMNYVFEAALGVSYQDYVNFFAK